MNTMDRAGDAVGENDSLPWASSVSVRLGKGDGTLGELFTYPSGTRTGGVASGDLDGDGKPDLVTTSYTDISPYAVDEMTVMLNRCLP